MKWLLALCLLLAPATALAKKDKKSDAVKTEDVETVEEEGDQKRKRKKWICGHMPGVVITPGGVGLMGVPHVMIARGCDEYYGRRRPPPPNSQPPPPRTSQRIVYNTNSLTMQAIDRYRDVEPYPRGDELDPSVCWAGVPPEGWEAVGPVRQLEIKNTTDQFVSLTVEKRTQETIESLVIDVVGHREVIGYHIPLDVGDRTALPPGDTCYGILPQQDVVDPEWSVTGTRLDHSGSHDQWIQEGEVLEYSDHRGRPIKLSVGPKKVYGVKDRGQRTSPIAFRPSSFP